VEAVAGVRTVHAGVARIDGHDVHELRERDRARVVAFVPQHPVVPTGMSLVDYVSLGRTAHHGLLQAESASDRDVVASVLKRFELADLRHRDVATLSGGERQRTVLARAMAQSTSVIILDEPTTGLDLRHQVEVLDLLRREVDENRLTVLATLHDLTLAGQFADSLALLSDGRLVRHGTSSDVVRDRALADAYGIDLRVIDVDGADVVVPLRRDPTS
jgi:iron complex transport system ATP-binding protein